MPSWAILAIATNISWVFILVYHVKLLRAYRRLSATIQQEHRFISFSYLELASVSEELAALMSQRACPLPRPPFPDGVLPFVGLLSPAVPSRN